MDCMFPKYLSRVPTVVWHSSSPLMNRFNKTKAAMWPMQAMLPEDLLLGLTSLYITNVGEVKYGAWSLYITNVGEVIPVHYLCGWGYPCTLPMWVRLSTAPDPCTLPMWVRLSTAPDPCTLPMWVRLYQCGWGYTNVGEVIPMWVRLYQCGWGYTNVGEDIPMWVRLY